MTLLSVDNHTLVGCTVEEAEAVLQKSYAEKSHVSMKLALLMPEEWTTMQWDRTQGYRYTGKGGNCQNISASLVNEALIYMDKMILWKQGWMYKGAKGSH